MEDSKAAGHSSWIVCSQILLYQTGCSGCRQACFHMPGRQSSLQHLSASQYSKAHTVLCKWKLHCLSDGSLPRKMHGCDADDLGSPISCPQLKKSQKNERLKRGAAKFRCLCWQPFSHLVTDVLCFPFGHRASWHEFQTSMGVSYHCITPEHGAISWTVLAFMDIRCRPVHVAKIKLSLLSPIRT